MFIEAGFIGGAIGAANVLSCLIGIIEPRVDCLAMLPIKELREGMELLGLLFGKRWPVLN